MGDLDPWMEKWIASVAVGGATMSQRQVSSVEAHGGIDAAIAAAKAAGVHLVQLTDDKGVELIAVSREPFKTLC